MAGEVLTRMMSPDKKNFFDPSAFPLLEYDPAREAKIEPSLLIQPRPISEHCVICFFKEVIEKIVNEKNAKIAGSTRWEDGPHPIYEIMYQDRRLAFFHPGVGAPLAAGLMEDAIAFGCRKFIVCGGCGVLQKDLALGQLIVVSSAVRDEGVSYHYLPAGRQGQAHPPWVAALERSF